MAGHGRIPDLTPWRAEEEANEEVDDVVNEIEPNERMDEVISHASADGDKDTQILEEDGEFGDVDQGDVKSFFSVEHLSFVVSMLDWRR